MRKLSFDVLPELLELWRKAAQADHRTLASWCRQVLTNAANQQLQTTPDDNASQRH